MLSRSANYSKPRPNRAPWSFDSLSADDYTLKTPLLFRNRTVVNASVAFPHQPIFIEFPHFISVTSIPLSFGLMPFIFKTDGNAVLLKAPELFLKLIIYFSHPLSGKKSFHLFASIEELRTVAPFGIDGIGKAHIIGIATVPRDFC